MKTIIFFIALVAFVLGIGARHQNSQTLRQLAQAAITADEGGQDIVAPLKRAQDFAAGHMSASFKLIFRASYQRAVEQAEAASQPGVANAQLYAQAQAACAGRGDSVVQARCNQDYVSKHLKPAAAPTPVVKPQLTDYTHEVRSPAWTPDLAGWSLAISAFMTFVGLVLLVHKRKFKA